jgi:hypothetical protein
MAGELGFCAVFGVKFACKAVVFVRYRLFVVIIIMSLTWR